MTDLETQLRQLDVDLATEPALTSAQVRALGGRRRRTRHTALATASIAVVSLGVAVGVTTRNGPDPTPPATSTSSSSTASPTAGPSWALAVEGRAGGMQPDGKQSDSSATTRAYVLSGAGAPAGVRAAVAGATIESTNGCLTLAPDPDALGPAAPRRVLVLPRGTRADANHFGLRLPDGQGINAGMSLTATVTVSPRTDTTFTEQCPGTAGYVVLADPYDVLRLASPTGVSPTPPPADPRVTAFPLGRGLPQVQVGKMIEPTRENVTLFLEGLSSCVVPADATPQLGMVDAIGTEMVNEAYGHTRILRLYRDEAAAQAVLERWRTQATNCRGGRLSAPPDRLVVSATYTTENGAGGAPGGGVFAATRVGSAVLTLRWEGAEGADADTLAGWRTEADDVLADLQPSMCVFAATGCKD